jgi:hypothetical protein
MEWPHMRPATDSVQDPSTVYLRKKSVKSRYDNVSDTWIDERRKDAGFPAPVYFGTNPIPFWRLSDLLAWEAQILRNECSRKPPTRRTAKEQSERAA